MVAGRLRPAEILSAAHKSTHHCLSKRKPSSSTMVHSLSLSKAVGNDRTMIKPKPSLPATANNKNLSSDNTLDYVGFWQQKALLHFTNSAYKGTFLIAMNQIMSDSSNIDWLTSYLYILAHIFCFVRHNIRAQICLCQDPHHSGSVGD